MRKIIDHLIKRLSPPKPPATVQSLVFNVPLSQIEEWTEDTLKEWLRITGTPESKIKEKALDIRVLLSQSGKELKEPRRVWNKFTVGVGLTFDELIEQQDAILDLLQFGDKHGDSSNKNGHIELMIDIDHGADKTKATGTISCVRLYLKQDGAVEGKQKFPVIDNQLDLDEIRAAIAKLKEKQNANN